MKKLVTLALSAALLLTPVVTAGPAFAAETQTMGSVMIDTKTYDMAPGNTYTYKVTLDGATEKDVKTTSSRSHIADVKLLNVQTVNGKVEARYLITGLQASKDPTTISTEVGNTHASIRVTVQDGIKQSGTATRNVSYFSLSSLSGNTAQPRKYPAQYYSPWGTEAIIQDMIKYGENLGMVYTPSLTKNDGWYAPDETYLYHPDYSMDADENACWLQKNCMGAVQSVADRVKASSGFYEGTRFRPYFEPVGVGKSGVMEYKIYVLYG